VSSGLGGTVVGSVKRETENFLPSNSGQDHGWQIATQPLNQGKASSNICLPVRVNYARAEYG
jgi:hypothetical protein